PTCSSTASSTDEEVSFRYSKKIGRTISESTFKAIYYLEHDFLKQTKDTSVITLFEQLDSWLKER
ncbi:alpha/beta hydrolase, partial [Enterococcus faecalis]